LRSEANIPSICAFGGGGGICTPVQNTFLFASYSNNFYLRFLGFGLADFLLPKTLLEVFNFKILLVLRGLGMIISFSLKLYVRLHELSVDDVL